MMRTTKYTKSTAGLLLACMLSLSSTAWGQAPSSQPATRPAEMATTSPATAAARAIRRQLTRDEELQQLDVRQAELALDKARSDMEKAQLDLEQVQSLFNEKIMALDELNQKRQAYEEARISHEQAKIDLKKKRLEFLEDATLLTVVDARKYRGETNEIFAAVTVRNDSDINKARIAMAGGDDSSDGRLAALLQADNVIVTLRGDAIVGDPFRRIIPSLAYGEERTLEFRLLKKDIENVTVELEFLGSTRQYQVTLKKEGQDDLPFITAGQYAQIGQLGSKITYELELERLAESAQSFDLRVLNLPVEIQGVTLDASKSALLTQVRFTEEDSQKKLFFEVSIPEKLSQQYVDADVRFFFLACRRSDLKQVEELQNRYRGQDIPAEEVAKLKASVLELTLIPRGVGKLDLLVPNLFKEIVQGEPLQIRFSVLNSGTLTLRRIRPELDLPLDWTATITPAEVDELPGGEKGLFTADVIPSADTMIGEYSIKMLAEGSVGMETVEADEKLFSTRIVARSNLTGTVLLVGLLVVLVLGIAAASIKISRR